MSIQSPQWVAGGNIAPSRFVMNIKTEDFTCVQATANLKVVGISMEGTREAPIPSVSTSLAAEDGENLQVYGNTEICLLELGGTVVSGDDLKSDADGKGVVSAQGSTSQQIGAVALQAGVSGNLILVQVQIGEEGATAVSS